MTADLAGEPPDLTQTKPAAHAFNLTVNGAHIGVDDNEVTGREIRMAARLNPASAFVLIQLRDGGSTSVGLDDKVVLHRGETAIFRAFEDDRLFTFTLDELGWEWGAASILESELRAYGQVTDDKDIVLDGETDQVVVRGAAIPLSGKGAERFFTRKAPPRKVEIRVNGRKRSVDPGLISYESMVKLAFPDAQPNPDVIYTVGFRHGPPSKPEGSLVAGQSVEVCEGMVFNVTPTNRS